MAHQSDLSVRGRDLEMDIKGVKNKVLINLCQDVRQYILGSCTNLNLLNIVFGR